jgi:hypothetical protein
VAGAARSTARRSAAVSLGGVIVSHHRGSKPDGVDGDDARWCSLADTGRTVARPASERHARPSGAGSKINKTHLGPVGVVA